MKAYVLESVNDLQYKDIIEPECREGWAIVDVKAAGICSSDISRILTKGTYHFPTIPGHEFSGCVTKVGCEKDSHWVGKRVGIFPLIPCNECSQCKKKHYEMCENYDYIGSRRDGGFAEKVAVPVWNLVELGDSISYEIGAMLEPLSVALHAMKQAQVRHGDSVAIVGTGMIGFAAAQWAKMMGAGLVTVIGRSTKKKFLAEKIDVEYCVYEENSKLYDVVLEAVGSNDSIDFAVNCVAPGGKLVLMGNPEGDIELSQKTYWRILRKQLHLVGTWNSQYESGEPCDWKDAVNALNENKIEAASLITHRFPQKELKRGLEMMAMHKELYCKVITVWNE